TGWVDEDGILRISARLNKVGNGEGVKEVRSPDAYLGYFTFDQSRRTLTARQTEVSDPTGEVGVVNAMPDHHAAWWVDTWWSNDSLELDVASSAEPRTLVRSGGRLYYAHQHGQYGA